MSSSVSIDNDGTREAMNMSTTPTRINKFIVFPTAEPTTEENFSSATIVFGGAATYTRIENEEPSDGRPAKIDAFSFDRAYSFDRETAVRLVESLIHTFAIDLDAEKETGEESHE